ncbi:MAG: hypothetical protein WA057_07010 [Candidatus Magasanikiibacteriota bacterium]
MKMNELKKLYYDTKKYSLISILTQPSWWGILNFRMAAFLWRLYWPFKIFYYFYFPVWRVVSVLLGIEIYGKTEIGPGLKIVHFGQIFINPRAIIGNNCLMYNSVTIGGSKYVGGVSPTIGNDVSIGVGAKILGDLSVSDGTKIGANSLLIK